MACKLSVVGKRWDVKGFVDRTGAEPDETFEKGDIFDSFGTLYKVSGFTFTLGPNAFVPLKRQVRAAVTFLELPRNQGWLRAASRERGTERRLEFGLARPREPANTDYLPARLAAAAGRYGFDLVVSHYPVGVEEPKRVRRGVIRRRLSAAGSRAAR